MDTAASPAVGAITLRWHTKVKYLTEVPLLYTYGMLVIKKTAFSKLSKGDRTLVREVLGRTFSEIDRRNRNVGAQALAVLKKQGVRFLKPPPMDLARWRETVETSVKRLERRGFFSKDLVARVRRLIADYRRGRR